MEINFRPGFLSSDKYFVKHVLQGVNWQTLFYFFFYRWNFPTLRWIKMEVPDRKTNSEFNKEGRD